MIGACEKKYRFSFTFLLAHKQTKWTEKRKQAFQQPTTKKKTFNTFTMNGKIQTKLIQLTCFPFFSRILFRLQSRHAMNWIIWKKAEPENKADKIIHTSCTEHSTQVSDAFLHSRHSRERNRGVVAILFSEICREIKYLEKNILLISATFSHQILDLIFRVKKRCDELFLTFKSEGDGGRENYSLNSNLVILKIDPNDLSEIIFKNWLKIKSFLNVFFYTISHLKASI